MVITEAFPKDAGVYSVIATSAAGQVKSVSHVNVKGRLPQESSDTEIPSDMEPVKPSVQIHLRDQSVFEGKKVRLDCVIVGTPEPEVNLYCSYKNYIFSFLIICIDFNLHFSFVNNV